MSQRLHLRWSPQSGVMMGIMKNLRWSLRWSPQSGVMMGIMKKRQMGIIYKLSCPKEKRKSKFKVILEEV